MGGSRKKQRNTNNNSSLLGQTSLTQVPRIHDKQQESLKWGIQAAKEAISNEKGSTFTRVQVSRARSLFGSTSLYEPSNPA
jgi:hypothetical protein